MSVEWQDVLPFQVFGGEILCVTSSACSTHSRDERGLAAAAEVTLHTIKHTATAVNHFCIDIPLCNERKERKQNKKLS